MSTTVLEEDFQGIAGDKTLFARENLEKLERCTVVITGATGLVGSLLLRSLLYLNDTCALHLTVIPVIRNKEKLKTILGEIPAAVCPVMADVTERDFVKEAGEKIRKILEHTGSQEPGKQAQEDRKEEGSRAKECSEEEEDRKSGRGNLYFFHCAAVTTSKTMVEKPVETIAGSPCRLLCLPLLDGGLRGHVGLRRWEHKGHRGQTRCPGPFKSADRLPGIQAPL